jgi:hypothetical protein|tara:strand:- start:60 stop:179 length:120 start_codon:yes stop_codon:yes gene_type:complete
MDLYSVASILLHALAIGACFYIGYTFGKQDIEKQQQDNS